MPARSRVRNLTDPDFGLPERREQEKGDPLVIVMQLEEINKKLDLALASLQRLEAVHGLYPPAGAKDGGPGLAPENEHPSGHHRY